MYNDWKKLSPIAKLICVAGISLLIFAITLAFLTSPL